MLCFLSDSKQGKPGAPGTHGPEGPKGERGERVSTQRTLWHAVALNSSSLNKMCLRCAFGFSGTFGLPRRERLQRRAGKPSVWRETSTHVTAGYSTVNYTNQHPYKVDWLLTTQCQCYCRLFVLNSCTVNADSLFVVVNVSSQGAPGPKGEPGEKGLPVRK